MKRAVKRAAIFIFSTNLDKKEHIGHLKHSSKTNKHSA